MWGNEVVLILFCVLGLRLCWEVLCVSGCIWDVAAGFGRCFVYWCFGRLILGGGLRIEVKA